MPESETRSSAGVPFDDSRRLTGPNPYFSGAGAVLETAIGVPVPDVLLDRWQELLDQALQALRWPRGAILRRVHASGATLGFEAPFDQLYAATEANEWAWLQALFESGRALPDPIYDDGMHAAAGDVAEAIRMLATLAREEANPALVGLSEAAAEHRLPLLADDEEVSIGMGEGSRGWPTGELPSAAAVPWVELHRIPVALVTGTNGKTTTVRLLAAMLRARGLHTAHSCTDGLYLDGELLAADDYSGPIGARTTLRNRSAQAAVLETARGGMLRRGLAIRRADVAVVTNVQPDHLGEYGIDDLDDLARVKLTVARAIDAEGLLVLNAEDERLLRLGSRLDCPRGWFAMNHDHPVLSVHRAAGGITCAPSAGRLLLSAGKQTQDLGAIAAMPMTLNGTARYNVANLAAASIAAHALGVSAPVISSVLARFGSDPGDNPGRLQHFEFGGIHALLDFAHNPDGIRGLLAIATPLRASGRLALTIGQAGDRGEKDLRDLADAAAAVHPDLVVVKELKGYERGRAAGEVAAILAERLRQRGLCDAQVIVELDEVAAARRVLSWARRGDILILLTHAGAARAAVHRLLATLHRTHWQPGQALPAPDPPAEQSSGVK